MNRKEVEFFFDVGSPTSYLAWTQLPSICEAANASLVSRPILLGGLFQATGNVSPATIPIKHRYTARDMARFAERYKVPLVQNPHFPINTLLLMRTVTGVQMRFPDRFDEFVSAIYRAMWVDSRDLNQHQFVVNLFSAAGFDPAELAAIAADPEVKNKLRTNTEEAAARGAFGAPTMYVNGEMFFGQDRLDFVKEALA